ncbi:MAG TPA: translation initiation factor eIF-1A [Candidatus Nanoarchaeia archaeon]|nr:translation initiation factor eIF-1A [Candidatus Nanoarchaeia archaeon]
MADEFDKKDETSQDSEDFGDESSGENQGSEEFIGRVKVPRGKQTLGILEQRLGGSRMRVRCMDGKIRICRVPGRLKRKLWVREGDVLLIEPWQLNQDDKGDVIYKYKSNQVSWLKKNGHLKNMETVEEF